MEIVVNGETVAVPKQLDDVALLDFIRDFIGLKGTKFGCGAGLCGACTVHINGVTVRSCQVSVADTAGRRVTTIEGAGGNEFDGDASSCPESVDRGFRAAMRLLPAGSNHDRRRITQSQSEPVRG